MDVSEQLRALGWSQNELARRLGLHRNTVVPWKINSEESHVPYYVKAYLDLAIQHEMCLQEIRRLYDKVGDGHWDF